MHSLTELIEQAALQNKGLDEVILARDCFDDSLDPEILKEGMRRRLDVLKETAADALAGDWHPKVAANDGPRLASYDRPKLCGDLNWRACQIAMALGTCNASMGRIVAAPTAGSCGIMPGMLLAYEEFRRPTAPRDLLSGLIVAAGVGAAIASRATLAGAEGGCQAECGSAAAMGAAALVWMEGGSADACGQAVAMTLKSITGLVCDPLAGLVEVPCIKRNGMLVSLGIIAADLALAGVKSLIPVDEMIDVMGHVGRALPPSLRETACGGLAVAPTAKKEEARLLNLKATGQL